MHVLNTRMWIAIGIVGGIIAIWILLKILGVRVIRSDQVGVVEKWWAPKGSLKDAIIALHGEAGYQPEVLRGGIHFKPPFVYRVRAMPLITIPQGKIGYVFARDGKMLQPEQTLGQVVECANFQDVRAFLGAGGNKGPQRAIMREGTYALRDWRPPSTPWRHPRPYIRRRRAPTRPDRPRARTTERPSARGAGPFFHVPCEAGGPPVTSP